MKGLCVMAAATAAVTLAACGSASSGGGNAGPITVGTSVPLTGGLGPIGGLLRQGYEQRVQEINQAGGLQVGDAKRRIDLKLLDNKSDPTLASQQTRELVTKDGATALLGAASPPLNIPMASAAESLRVPMVIGLNPIRAFLAGSKSGWHYAWAAFFDETQATKLAFNTADLTNTNKKVALFTDNEADGTVMGDLWEKTAPAMGYSIVYHGKFPVGTTDFSSFINKAKATGAEVAIAQAIPPDGAALWKQMKALRFQPKLAFCEKCGTNGAWPAALGPIAQGTGGFSNWSPNAGLPGTAHIEQTLGKKIKDTPDLGLAVAGYGAASILLDAITTAGTSDPDAVNAAIGKTDKDYPIGHVKFVDNAYGTPTTMLQWQGADAKQVYPAVDGIKLQTPVHGLG
ncbi:MAG: hypothetical protein JWR63_231 [Conexibacter sp.]|nr:hypothetical protein [Conexibacter sp.]